MKRYPSWSEAEIEWLRKNYVNLTQTACANHLSRKRHDVWQMAKKLGLKPRVKRKTPQFTDLSGKELEICEMYQRTLNLGVVAKYFNTHYGAISKILKRNNIEIRPYSRFREFQDQIVADYRLGTMSVVDIGKKYGLSNDRITEGLKELGEYDPSRYDRFNPKIGLYALWVQKYGKEKADQLIKEKGRRHSEIISGKKNPMFNKPSPQGAGNGWKGWYKETHYFRSLRELAFMLQCDHDNLVWKSAESKQYTIHYEFNGRPRTYRPDFIIETTLYEIKPTKLHNSPNVAAKRAAAEAFCASCGLTYSLQDIEINFASIWTAYQDGRVKFDRGYGQKLIDYAKEHGLIQT